MRLANKVVVVTGGSRGIGEAISIRFAKEGAKIVVNGCDDGEFSGSSKSVVEQIRSFGGEAIAFDCDVSSAEQVAQMFDVAEETFGKIDVLVANAGICPFAEFLNIDEALLDKTIGVNQKGVFFCAQQAMKRMIDKNIKGRILMTSSVSSVFGGELQTHYCATKGAVNQLMKSIAIAAGQFGITANAVLPGTVITDINRKELEADPELLDYFVKRTPIGRLVTPDDIAAAMLFFASDESSGVSGATLIVDGGMSVNLQ
ncbi:MAG: short-chain dehydrogenase [Proteobacteria bacterium]|nr:short-chain dehydrogenase [Pseudomonadota bacterium]